MIQDKSDAIMDVLSIEGPEVLNEAEEVMWNTNNDVEAGDLYFLDQHPFFGEE